MTSPVVHRGGCLCGKVRYRIERSLDFITHCHCRMCQRQHGAAFATYAVVRRSAFSFEGDSSNVRRYESSAKAARSFCSVCGSSLFWESSEFPKHFDVAVATLDEPPEHQPVAHIFVTTKAPWHVIGDDLPQYPEAPPIPGPGSSTE